MSMNTHRRSHGSRPFLFLPALHCWAGGSDMRRAERSQVWAVPASSRGQFWLACCVGTSPGGTSLGPFYNTNDRGWIRARAWGNLLV